MKYLIFTLFMVSVVISSCTSIDFSKQRYVQFHSNMEMTSFFLSAPLTLKSEGFAVVSLNDEEGTLRANKSVKGEFSIDILLSFDVETQNVLITILNRIKESDGERIEYYNLEEYNRSFEKHFHPAVTALKVNATKTAFPNRNE